ncbi:hypothetical protein BJ322DRAFT_1128850 [Thelephora terrestris]|uniref:Uncharacterized protein n=1 Tax=Thelephora terrestris TaxID=56493 RepID=A0A9P6H6Q4_9AGAM|nr:hypothetical protein BJ322DRAFT_1128850 [Thelephora terrestris]
MFLLDALDSFPRLRISDALMKIFLWVLGQSGVRDVPSLKELRKMQESLRAESGVPTEQFRSPQGNIFFQNDIRDIIAKDYSNPLIRPHLEFYPEITDGHVSEVWQGEKWRKRIDPRILTPMVAIGSRHFYVFEFARLRDGRYIVPERWVKYKGELYAEAFEVDFSDGRASVIDERTTLVSVKDLKDNYYDLQEKNLLPDCDTRSYETYVKAMPNPDRVIAGGAPLYTSFADYFADDVSGNKSKAWNKHWNIYTAHRNLPRRYLQQEFHVHLVSTSPTASISEQFSTLKKTIESTHTNPITVYDVQARETARVRIFIDTDRSDNPMQSEIACHIGSKGNFPCRRCEVGGTQKEKESDDGYESFFLPGKLRSAPDVINSVKEQLYLACRGKKTPVATLQTATGVKDPHAQFWIDDIINRAIKGSETRPADEVEKTLKVWVDVHEHEIISSHLTLRGFDPTRDSPVELLHTILLGIVKYAWHMSHTPWKATKKSTFTTRLHGLDWNSVSVHSVRPEYMIQYAKSLVGRQLKTIIQSFVFVAYDLVSSDLFSVWKAIGELTALLWMSEIVDPKQHQGDLEIAIANVLDSFATIDPLKIISKIKLHLLTHIPDDVRDYGPLVGEATEVFECFNAVFRSCSVLSNHQAPSRDIAVQLGGQDGFKQRISGGWWKTKSGDWVQAGIAIREKLSEDPVLRNNLGWAGEAAMSGGSIKLSPYVVPKKGPRYRPSKTWRELMASKAGNASQFCEDPEQPWFEVKYSVSMKSNDQCYVGSWVFAVVRTPDTSSGSAADPPEKCSTICGRIVELLAPTECEVKGLAVITVYQMLESRHPIFGMPRLAKVTPPNGQGSVVVPVEDLEFNFNVQHDCPSAGCSATGKRARRQERIVCDDILDDAIEHRDIDQWVINTHSLHNGHLLRLRVRRELISPVRLIPADERQQRHRERASTLRPGQEKRRKKAADERAAKKAVTVDPKQEAPKAGPKPGGEEFMDVDEEGAMVP